MWVTFMHLNMWAHATKSGMYVGCTGVSLSTVDDALSLSLHTSKEDPPVEFTVCLPLPWSLTSCLNWWTGIDLELSHFLNLIFKINENSHKQMRKLAQNLRCHPSFLFILLGEVPLNISSFLWCDSQKWWTNWTDTKPRVFSPLSAYRLSVQRL